MSMNAAVPSTRVEDLTVSMSREHAEQYVNRLLDEHMIKILSLKLDFPPFRGHPFKCNRTDRMSSWHNANPNRSRPTSGAALTR
ncbi:MAG: hypothetical protein PF961_22125, partial [Planctomycetota bacterium]|nr:hypothetical protein [Planctomycetota bacterium]